MPIGFEAALFVVSAAVARPEPPTMPKASSSPERSVHRLPPPSRSTASNTAVFAAGKIWWLDDLELAAPSGIFVDGKGQVHALYGDKGARARLRTYRSDGSFHDASLPFANGNERSSLVPSNGGFFRLDPSATSVSHYVPRSEDAFRISAHLRTQNGPVRGVLSGDSSESVWAYRHAQLVRLTQRGEEPVGPKLSSPIERAARGSKAVWILTADGSLVDLSNDGEVRSTQALGGRGIALAVRDQTVAVVTATREVGHGLRHSLHLLDGGPVRSLVTDQEGIPEDRTLVVAEDFVWFGGSVYPR